MLISPFSALMGMAFVGTAVSVSAEELVVASKETSARANRLGGGGGVSSNHGQKVHQNHRVLQEAVSGVLLVGFFEPGLESHSPVRRLASKAKAKESGSSVGSTHDVTTYNVEVEGGYIYQMQNIGETFFEDDAGGSSKAAKLSAKSSKAHVIIPAGATMSGGTIDLHGVEPSTFADEFADDYDERRMKEELVDSNGVEPTDEEVARHVAALRRRLAQGPSGIKKIVAVKVTSTATADNPSYEWTVPQLSNFVFGTSGDIGNLKSQYEACSYNKLSINYPQDVVDNGLVGGAVEINVANPVSDGDLLIRNAVTEAINTKFGVSDPTDIADHWMYCLPPGVMGGVAYAFINGWMSVYNNKWCNMLSAQMHELGHNFGYAHSGENEEYDDKSGMMGFSYESGDFPKQCFNAAKSWQTGWYSDASKTIAAAGCYNGRLYGINAYYSGNPNKTVLVKVETGTTDYYINFNRRAGINEGTQEGGDTVMVISATGDGVDYAPSTSRAKLIVGQSYAGPGFSVTTTSINLAESWANVIIGGPSCHAPPTPPPTPVATPPPMPSDGPPLAAFNVGLGAPTCGTVGTGCRSGDLLKKRGSMGGGELNQPNSIDTCIDGNAGNYLEDESMEAITITDKNGGIMTTGSEVVISADVFAWGSGMFDSTDFYYTADASANSVAWTHIETKTPTNSGANTIMVEHTLAAGPLQAVRVIFRGGHASPKPCSPFLFNDVDDLVFAVASTVTPPPSTTPSSSPTTSPTPPPTPSPTLPVVPVDNFAAFSGAHGAPLCRSNGISCSSGKLLVGRGTVGNDEPNRPNSLDTCNGDGRYGQYHVDESIETIKVRQTAGRVMAEGTEVEIDAGVWAWSTGGSDYADFYYAQDATAPEWKYITTIKPTKGGASHIKAKYNLQLGSLQAVRVVFRYRGFGGSMKVCPTGYYDDVDDLAFAVAPGMVRAAPVHGYAPRTFDAEDEEDKLGSQDEEVCPMHSKDCGPETPCSGRDKGKCCSQYGYCGTGEEFCGTCCQQDCLEDTE